MLTILLPAIDGFDENTSRFVQIDEFELSLEHSLVSLSKWEETFEKPFLGNSDKTTEETLAYIRFMIVTPNTPPDVFSRVTQEHIEQINKYINSKMTATWFAETSKGKGPSRQTITAEVIYYWMFSLGIPLEFENRHLNKLLTQVRVCNQMNNPPKKGKMSQAEMLAQRRALNDKRRAELGTRG